MLFTGFSANPSDFFDWMRTIDFERTFLWQFICLFARQGSSIDDDEHCIDLTITTSIGHARIDFVYTQIKRQH